MRKWNILEKPRLDVCPEKYCFCWTPPGGSADFSRKGYDTFEEAVEAGKKGVTFLHGGCASPLRPCRRGTNNPKHRDSYEPFERALRKDGFPDLYFCSPDSLGEEFKEEYRNMAQQLWSEDV